MTEDYDVDATMRQMYAELAALALKASLDDEIMRVIMTLVVGQKLKPGHHEFKLSFELKEVVNGYDIFDQYLVETAPETQKVGTP